MPFTRVPANETWLISKALDAGVPPQDILSGALIVGMQRVGVRFRNKEIFVPDVLMAAKAMAAAMDKATAKERILLAVMAGQAKIAGIKMCQAYRKQYGCRFISVMPTNLYGRGDNYHSENAHVLPALIRKFHEAKSAGVDKVAIWGTGAPRREFMYADDLGDACVFLMEHYDDAQIINAGSGEEVSILELAQLIAETVGFKGEIATDPTRPDGTPRKLLDSSRLHALGYRPAIRLKEGLPLAYADFLSKQLETTQP